METLFVTVDRDAWAEYCLLFPHTYAREPDSDTMEHVSHGVIVGRITGYNGAGERAYLINVRALRHFAFVTATPNRRS